MRKRCHETGWGGDTAAVPDSHPCWPGLSPVLHTLLGSVSKDGSLFLEERFISFHSNCLLLSWACNSAGLCYKGASQLHGPNLAAPGMARRALCPTEPDLQYGRMCHSAESDLEGALRCDRKAQVLPMTLLLTQGCDLW